MRTQLLERVSLIAALMLIAACAESPQAGQEVAGKKLNPNASTSAATGSGDSTADDQKSGMNTTRPDSNKDLKSPE